MSSDLSLSLRVRQAYFFNFDKVFLDVSLGIGRIHPKSMSHLGIAENDIIEIEAKRRSFVRCLPLETQDSNEIIRIERIARYNIRADIGDIVSVRKKETVESADRVTLRPLKRLPPDIKHLVEASIVNRLIEDKRPAIKGDIVNVGHYRIQHVMIQCIIVDSVPDSKPLIFDKNTVVTFEDQSSEIPYYTSRGEDERVIHHFQEDI
jgi:hypothetical protein